MKIHVTQDHINRAECGHVNKCAIAAALQDATKCFVSYVDAREIVCWSDGWSFRLEPTPEMVDFRPRFDRNKSCPALFSFEVPDALLPSHLRKPERVAICMVVTISH
jgi:hypothetical protein